jgi:hypothetical protein
MLKGVHLTLLIGPGVPVPAPRPVIDALTGVQVSSRKDRGGFQLTFAVGNRSPLLAMMLPAGFFDPMITRVIIVVTVNGLPQVLMDGMVTRQDVTPSNEPGHSTLTVTGEDLSILMDVTELPFMRFPGLPVFGEVAVILAKYAVLGIVPLVVPPLFGDTDTPNKQVSTQSGTDLDQIKRHAKQNGYVFYLEPGPAPGSNIAYFGPDIRIPIPQPALNVNMDAETNVESLTFALDGLSKKVVITNILDPITMKIPIPVPVPNVNLLRPPLGARIALPSKIEFEKETAHLTPGKAVGRALANSAAATDSITATGTLNVLRYGRVLRSRMLVGVRGAGLAYDGLYYVNNVTHDIKPGQYKQNFTLSRDGLMSLTPRVPV